MTGSSHPKSPRAESSVLSVFGSDCFETLRNNVAVTKISPENEIV